MVSDMATVGLGPFSAANASGCGETSGAALAAALFGGIALGIFFVLLALAGRRFIRRRRERAGQENENTYPAHIMHWNEGYSSKNNVAEPNQEAFFSTSRAPSPPKGRDEKVADI